jgi:protein required for attachment to host cells
MDTWIVTANAGRARIFSRAARNAPLEPVEDLLHPEGRMRDSELETDSLGERAGSDTRHNTGGAVPESSYQPHQTPSQHEDELFARRVSAYLKRQFDAGRFGELYLAASPEFLGVLRRELDPQVMKAVKVQVDKDYTRSDPRQLSEQIEARRH